MTSETHRTVAVIPARYGSTRFPGKPLAPIAGKAMVQWVYDAASASRRIDHVIVATDDRRILEAVQGFGGTAVMTREDHETGTDRIAEAIAGVEADLVINVQGDEPLLPPELLDELIEGMVHTGADMGTLAAPFAVTGRDVNDPNAVKVVRDARGFALYFSRAPIPCHRAGGTAVEPLLHWGIYAYRRTFLEQFVTWERGELECCEMLEQLRALENGADILVLRTEVQSAGVDVPEDVQLVEKLLGKRR